MRRLAPIAGTLLLAACTPEFDEHVLVYACLEDEDCASAGMVCAHVLNSEGVFEVGDDGFSACVPPEAPPHCMPPTAAHHVECPGGGGPDGPTSDASETEDPDVSAQDTVEDTAGADVGPEDTAAAAAETDVTGPICGDGVANCACSDHADCPDSQLCADVLDIGAKHCTVACDDNDDCPGLACTGTGLSSPDKVCMAPALRACQPCVTADDCSFEPHVEPRGAPPPDWQCLTPPFEGAYPVCMPPCPAPEEELECPDGTECTGLYCTAIDALSCTCSDLSIQMGLSNCAGGDE